MFAPAALRPRAASSSAASTAASSPCLRSQGWTLPKSSPSLSSPAAGASSFFASLLSPPPASPFSPSSPAYASCAYPSWPNRASLSPALDHPSARHQTPVSAYASCASSHISDDDLRDLECWDAKAAALHDPAALDLPLISWSDTRQPPAGLGGEERRYGRRPAPRGMVLDSRRKRSRTGRKTGKA